MVAGLSCPSETVKDHNAQPVRATDGIVVFFTGSELGALKPCGCSGGQLGGLSKRRAVFDRVPVSNRMVIGAGALVKGAQEQDLIKFRILFEAFRLLDYDVVHLTGPDVEIARNLGLLTERNDGFALLSAEWRASEERRPRTFSKTFRVQGREVTVNVATFDAQVDPVERGTEFFEGRSGELHFNILLLQNCDPQLRRAWAQGSGADCLLCPSDSDEPQVLSEPGAEPLIFTVGRFGRHIGRLQVDFSESAGRLVSRLEDVPVEETLPEDEALVRLYGQYQQIVRESRLLEAYPRIPLPGDLRYVGSQNCASCHEYEHSKWSDKSHADAFATLVRVSSDHDPECVVCHVVGMDRDSGFVTAQKTTD